MANSNQRAILPKGKLLIPRPIGVVQTRTPVRQQVSTRLKSCPLTACQRLDCNLRTHWRAQELPKKQDRRRKVTTRAESLITSAGVNPQSISHGSKQVNETSDTIVLHRDSLHGLPAFPLDVSGDPSFRQLFHEFFQNLHDKLELIISPPPVSRNRKIEMLSWAVSSRVFFLNILTMSHNYYMTKDIDRHDESRSATLYGRVTQILMQKLQAFNETDAENLILIIATLITLETLTGRTKSLTVHRRGLTDLVSRKGGVHNLTVSLRQTLHIDRILAVYTETPALYSPPMDRRIRRPRQNLETYGRHFTAYAYDSGIEQDVVEQCLDLCEVLEEFENQGISYDVKDAGSRNSPGSYYFYYIRDRVGCHFTHLNAKYGGEKHKTKCVLLASKIVEYPTLYDNWIADLPSFLARKLHEILQGQDLDQEWYGYDDMLIWILFVLTTMPRF